ncbi:MAG: hypothetical protein OHK0046_02260 [Anaerolineae bacterium]
MQQPIIVYGHSTCPGVPPVLGVLKAAQVNYEYINIRTDQAARARVREINNGYESVPTLVFPDGSTLTEPSPGALQRKLRTMGYEVSLLSRILGQSGRIIIGIGVLFALLRALGVV